MAACRGISLVPFHQPPWGDWLPEKGLWAGGGHRDPLAHGFLQRALTSPFPLHSTILLLVSLLHQTGSLRLTMSGARGPTASV